MNVQVNSFFECPEFLQPTAFFNIANLLISCLHAPGLPSKSARSKVARRRSRIGRKIRRSVTQWTPTSTATRMDRCFAGVCFIRFLECLKGTDHLHPCLSHSPSRKRYRKLLMAWSGSKKFPGNLVFVILGHTFLSVEICRGYLHHIAEDSFVFYNSVSARSTLCCQTNPVAIQTSQGDLDEKTDDPNC